MVHKLVPLRLAAYGLLGSLALVLVFHGLVIGGVLPPDLVWGGMAVGDRVNFLLLEAVAVSVTLLFAVLVLFRAGVFERGRSSIVVTTGIWLMFGYLVLSTVANVASGAQFDNWFFAPGSAVLALLTLRLALE